MAVFYAVITAVGFAFCLSARIKPPLFVALAVFAACAECGCGFVPELVGFVERICVAFCPPFMCCNIVLSDFCYLTRTD